MTVVRLLAACVVAHCSSMRSARASAAAYTEHPTARCDVTCAHHHLVHVATRLFSVPVHLTQHLYQAYVHALTIPFRHARRFRLPQCSSRQHAQHQQRRNETGSIKAIVPDRAPAGCHRTHSERDAISLHSRSSHSSACLHPGSQEALAAAHTGAAHLIRFVTRWWFVLRHANANLSAPIAFAKHQCCLWSGACSLAKIQTESELQHFEVLNDVAHALYIRIL